MNCQDLLLGTAIGDAFGAGVEFQDRDWIRAHVDFSSLVNARASIDVPREQLGAFVEHYTPWEYTDDTEMTVGLCKALMSSSTFSEELLVVHWEAEYQLGRQQKGYGRNGHGSMSWYYKGEKTMAEIRDFQENRPNPGNAPAMRATPLGLLPSSLINTYAAINAQATHPNTNAILSSQCIARAAEFLLVKKANSKGVIDYCRQQVPLNEEYQLYLQQVQQLPDYHQLKEVDFAVLCGPQPIAAPYFLAGIKGLPSDSKYTTGAVLYLLQQSTTPFDGLKKAVYLGGDVDSVASIVTGMLAANQGLDSLPDYMVQQVEGVDYLREIGTALEEYFSSAFL